MKRNLYRALGAVLLAGGGVALSVAQTGVGVGPDNCIDPMNTTPYSNPYGFLFASNALFGAGIGLFGTVTYSTSNSATDPVLCPFGGAAPIVGRIGFTVGSSGSIQDNQRPDLYGGVHDDLLRLTYGEGTYSGLADDGAYTPASGGTSYARIYVTTVTNTGTGTAPTTVSANYLYGINGLSGYSPAAANGRYLVTSTTVTTNVLAQCIIEVLADGARVNWTLTNDIPAVAGATTSLGLYFGQVVGLSPSTPTTNFFSSIANGVSVPYITAPGLKPITTEKRFQTGNVPAYVDFSGTQTEGFGLQVVNLPSALAGFDPNASADQTPVDEFAIGLTPFLINGNLVTTDPSIGDFLFADPNTGTNLPPLPAALDILPGYLQKWLPLAVDTGLSRTITSYYRSTNFDSSYAPILTGYIVAVDTPKVISTTQTTSGTTTSLTFDPNPFTIRVNVDNTGQFSTDPTKFVDMQNVVVTLNLPNGMHAVGDPGNRILSGTIKTNNANNTIHPGNIGSIDFQVQVDPTVVGAQTYTVSVTPKPGTFITKTITGTINVATTPRLLIRSGPNLVAPPWEYDDNSWGTILSDTLNGGFQAYTYDDTPGVQKYVPQGVPERRRGTWIISATDRGNLALGGNPQVPADQLPDPTEITSGGAGSFHLYPGWNLIGNPYTYAFPLGQLNGVVPGGQVLTYDELVSGSYTDGAFTYYDQDLKSYGPPIQGSTARLQPNLGYWIYANSEFDLVYPPLFDLFIRSALPAAQPQRFNNWQLQLSATNASQADSQNFMGVVRNPFNARIMTNRKAPETPTANTKAVYAYLGGTGGTPMSRVMRNSTGQQKFDYTVKSRSAGPVTVSWPNLAKMPSNLDVQIKDAVTGKTLNARSTSGYTYTAGGASSRAFQVTVTPLGTVAQRVNTLATNILTMGGTKQMRIDYSVTGRGAATITVLKGNQVVATIADDQDISVGSNSILWAMVGNDGHLLPNGNYTLQVAAAGESGQTAYRQATITLRR